jgi:hypothetical protein
MAERDKVIKSGQLTVPRILFLVVVGGLIVFTVYAGGIFLSIGYWGLTIAICVLLFLIAVDYGVTMEKVSLATQPAEIAAAAESGSAATSSIKSTISEPRPKKRASRPAKRRR